LAEAEGESDGQTWQRTKDKGQPSERPEGGPARRPRAKPSEGRETTLARRTKPTQALMACPGQPGEGQEDKPWQRTEANQQEGLRQPNEGLEAGTRRQTLPRAEQPSAETQKANPGEGREARAHIQTSPRATTHAGEDPRATPTRAGGKAPRALPRHGTHSGRGRERTLVRGRGQGPAGFAEGCDALWRGFEGESQVRVGGKGLRAC
jgi:hypothetical protein